MRINELDSVCSPEKQDRIHEFCDWCCEKLGINTPPLHLKPANDTSALGYTNMDDGSVTIVVGDRHQMDIMRTLAHELVHCKQMESYTPDGATGSDDENEANAMAGVLMREWGQQNPDLYTEGASVKEGADLGNDIHKISRAKTKKYVNTDATPEAKQKMSAQDRFNKRLKDKHGMDLDAKEKFYADMKKKFQQSLDRKDEGVAGTLAGAGLGGAAGEWGGRELGRAIGTAYGGPVGGAVGAGAGELVGKAVGSLGGAYAGDAIGDMGDDDVKESKTARMMALITALGAAYGLEDDAREFAHKIQQNIDNAQNAEPNPGRPDPVTKGNPLPGSDRVMRPPVDEIAPAVAAVGRGAAAVGGAVARGVGSAARGATKAVGRQVAKHQINKMSSEIEDDEANEVKGTVGKILKGAPGAPSGRPKSMREKAVSKSQQRFFGMVDALKKGEKVKGATKDMRKAAKDMSTKDVKDFARTKHKGLPNKVSEAINVQSIKDEVMGAVRSGNPREMKRVDDTIAKRISDLMDLRGTAGKEVDAEISTALPVLKKAQMYLRDKKKVAEGDVVQFPQKAQDASFSLDKEIHQHAERHAIKGKDLEKYVGKTVTLWTEGSSNPPLQRTYKIDPGQNGQGVTIEGEYYGPEEFVTHNSADDYSWKSQSAADLYSDMVDSDRDDDEDYVDEAKKDACYNKVRSRYKVWPSAYASGALVQCRKKGAKNWGNKSKK